MMMEGSGLSCSYNPLASVYDLIQKEYQPERWADYIAAINQRFGRGHTDGDGQDGKPLMADLGCGTGRFCMAMAERGYDTIGIDLSPAMLEKAQQTWLTEKKPVCPSDCADPLFIRQDITRFELFGTVDLMVSLLDTLNHITYKPDLKRLFRLSANYLNPGGLFIFDLATEHHLHRVLGNQVFYDDQQSYTLLWQNTYLKHRKVSISDLVLFTADQEMETYRDQKGTPVPADSDTPPRYTRHELQIIERYYSRQDIETIIEPLPLTLIACYNPFSTKKAEKNAQRHFYVLQRLTSE